VLFRSLSAYLGDILKRDFNIPDRRADKELSKVWADKVAAYYEEKAAQEKELAEFGFLKSLVVEKEKE
jgi:hypothetical protein